LRLDQGRVFANVNNNASALSLRLIEKPEWPNAMPQVNNLCNCV
jgi:hypothetical protein